ncbi:MAG TPA: IPT/TIG domain-containing protein [Cyclobacteriaceae bacterium]|jgi:uncharacterized protein (TIGR03437 family)|nr:IPT/TIG domain-containing protein [Cyclobacteriaceae bacterium]
MERKFIFIVLFLFAGCDDKLSWIKTPDPIIPVVYTITPDRGTVGTEIKVSGTNFSTTLSKNKITINGTSATITEASATVLTFIAPNETSGPVLVTVNNHLAENRPVFTYE